MIDSRPKIEERQVIKKEISEYASDMCTHFMCFFFYMDILYKQFEF